MLRPELRKLLTQRTLVLAFVGQWPLPRDSVYAIAVSNDLAQREWQEEARALGRVRSDLDK